MRKHKTRGAESYKNKPPNRRIYIYISVERVPKGSHKYSRCNILFLYIASSQISLPSSGRRHLHYIYTT